MTSFEPRQLFDEFGRALGVWAYTSDDGKGPQRVGRCAKFVCRHSSATEARECYRQQITQDEIAFDAERLETGETCAHGGKSSNGCSGDANWKISVQGKYLFPLCDGHRNQDGALAMLDFADGIAPVTPATAKRGELQ